MTDKTPGQLSTTVGSLLSIAVTIDCGNLIKSVLLGAIGTIVSYGVSRIMKRIFETPTPPISTLVGDTIKSEAIEYRLRNRWRERKVNGSR